MSIILISGILHQGGAVHAKKEIVALYKEIVEGTISDGWI